MNQPASDLPIVWLIGGEDIRMRIPILLALRDMGFHIAAVGTEDSSPFERHGIEYHYYQLKRGISPVADMTSCRQLTELFRKYRPDVVHTFDTKPGMLAPIAAHLADISCKIRTVTGMGYVYSSDSYSAQLLKPIYRHMQRHASRFADATIFQNADDKIFFESMGLIKNDKSYLVKSSGVDVVSLCSKRIGEDEITILRDELGLGEGLIVTMVARMVQYAYDQTIILSILLAVVSMSLYSVIQVYLIHKYEFDNTISKLLK